MPKLIVQEGYHRVRDFLLPEGETIVGRGPDCQLVLERQGISRHHVKLIRTAQEVALEDMESRNGTFLNSVPVTTRVSLRHLDVIQLGGDTILVYNETGGEGEEHTVDGKKAADTRRDFDLAYLREVVQSITANIARVVRGKDDVITRVIVTLLSDGHVLIEDVPGVGNTMLAQALARSVRTEFKRIQFTPDMLPTDVTGVNVYDEQSRQFRFMPGPIFANVILADEINRGTPRVQSSLLECMNESRVTVDGRTQALQKPFFVIATQNPVDFHGTYPLPEAQLDRFLMRLRMGYPEKDVEQQILASQVAGHPITDIGHVVTATDVLQCQALVRTVHVSDPVKDYIVTIVKATREHSAFAYGCSPRASLGLMRAGQSMAAIKGREYVLPLDIRDLARPVLAHRLPLKMQARAEWENTEQVIGEILDRHPVEKWEQVKGV